MIPHLDSGGAPMHRPDIDAFIARLVSRRDEAEYFADRLIEALDDADGDSDIEDGADDEPSFGASHIAGRYDECEDVSEDEGACIQSQPHDGDDVVDACEVEDVRGEPSLGSLDRHMDQRRWAGTGFYNTCDRELDRSDFEPSLGSLQASPHQHDQSRWGASATLDREPNGDEMDEDCRRYPRNESEMMAWPGSVLPA